MQNWLNQKTELQWRLIIGRAQGLGFRACFWLPGTLKDPSEKIELPWSLYAYIYIYIKLNNIYYILYIIYYILYIIYYILYIIYYILYIIYHILYTNILYIIYYILYIIYNI